MHHFDACAKKDCSFCSQESDSRFRLRRLRAHQKSSRWSSSYWCHLSFFLLLTAVNYRVAFACTYSAIEAMSCPFCAMLLEWTCGESNSGLTKFSITTLYNHPTFYLYHPFQVSNRVAIWAAKLHLYHPFTGVGIILFPAWASMFLIP